LSQPGAQAVAEQQVVFHKKDSHRCPLMERGSALV
jgi:hypothetical protein